MGEHVFRIFARIVLDVTVTVVVMSRFWQLLLLYMDNNNKIINLTPVYMYDIN